MYPYKIVSCMRKSWQENFMHEKYGNLIFLICMKMIFPCLKMKANGTSSIQYERPWWYGYPRRCGACHANNLESVHAKIFFTARL